MNPHSDIIVVGAGPAGLSFARALADSDLNVTLVEQSPEAVLADPPYDGREIALTHLSKEIMQRLTLWQRVDPAHIYRLRDAKVVNGRSPYQLHFPQPQQARGGPTDCLGYLIANHHIRQAAYQAVKEMPRVQLRCGVAVQNVATDTQQVQVTLNNGVCLSARLLVAADSRFSATRRQLGIAADMHDFGRTVIVFRMQHTLSNQHTAFECFHYGRTLALLPLTEYLTNCVVTLDSHETESVLTLSPTALAQDIQNRLHHRLGEMTLASDRHSYPLVGVHARRFYGQRSALIGDAAVGMHPVTAHGYNLGLHSADTLSRLVQQAARQGQDIGGSHVLLPYHVQHMLHTRPLYHGTQMMVKLFTNDAPPAKLLRGLVLRASNNLPPLKQLISQQLTG